MIEAFLIFIFGLIIGSFLNVVVLRLKANEQFTRGRSRCPHCRHFLGFWDLLPVVSFIFLLGKCRYCHKPIAWQYPLVELAAALVFVVGFFHYFPVSYQAAALPAYLAYLVFVCFLIIIFVYDLKYYLILDSVTLSGFILALLFNLWLGRPLGNLLLASIIIAGFFALQFIFSKGKWIGGGDIKLGLVIGAMLGWPMALTALILAYLLGSVVGLILIAAKKKGWQSEMPFGTFLALTTWAVLLWGDSIVNWYWHVFL